MRPDHALIATYRRDKILPRPDMLADKVALAFTINARHMDRTFPLVDVPNHL